MRGKKKVFGRGFEKLLQIFPRGPEVMVQCGKEVVPLGSNSLSFEISRQIFLEGLCKEVPSK